MSPAPLEGQQLVLNGIRTLCGTNKWLQCGCHCKVLQLHTSHNVALLYGTLLMHLQHERTVSFALGVNPVCFDGAALLSAAVGSLHFWILSSTALLRNVDAGLSQ